MMAAQGELFHVPSDPEETRFEREVAQVMRFNLYVWRVPFEARTRLQRDLALQEEILEKEVAAWEAARARIKQTTEVGKPRETFAMKVIREAIRRLKEMEVPGAER